MSKASALFFSWLVALISSLSVLFIGEVMGQTPCILCWFQRAFMFPLVLILGVALYRSDAGGWRYALPVALTGWLIAVYHTLLYTGLIPKAIEPCGAGPSCTDSNMMIFQVVPIPLLSVLVFSLIIFLLLIVRKGSTHE